MTGCCASVPAARAISIRAATTACDPGSQGIREDPAWEAPLFRCFDALRAHPEGVLLGVCHTFGVMCRWLGVADADLRGPEKGGKSAGILENVLTPAAARTHPWFGPEPAGGLPSQRMRILDSRLYDLIPHDELLRDGSPPSPTRRSASAARPAALTMLEVGADRADGMPRILGVNHHPRSSTGRGSWRSCGDACGAARSTTDWYEERSPHADGSPRRSRRRAALALTSSYTLPGPLRYHLLRRLRRRPRRSAARGRCTNAPRRSRCLPTGEVHALDGLEPRCDPEAAICRHLTLEEELRRFEELKPRLNQVWDVLMRTADQPGTSVVVPSLTLDQEELRSSPAPRFTRSGCCSC